MESYYFEWLEHDLYNEILYNGRIPKEMETEIEEECTDAQKKKLKRIIKEAEASRASLLAGEEV